MAFTNDGTTVTVGGATVTQADRNRLERYYSPSDRQGIDASVQTFQQQQAPLVFITGMT